MSNRNVFAPRRKSFRGRTSGKLVVLPILLLSLIAAAVATNDWYPRFRPKPSPRHLTVPATMQGGPSPHRLSKEYIYVGGRLVAVESHSGPSNLRYVQTSTVGFTTNGYLSWNDNNNNETGFIVESLNSGPGGSGVWSTFAQVGPNITTHTISVNGPGYDFRIKATYADGTTDHTNVIHVMGPGCYCISAPEGSAPCPQICYATSTCTPPLSLIISEFRLRGALGNNDEFVELYNQSDSPIIVCTADTSGGWTLAARTSDGSATAPVFTIPGGTEIPARGHYLAVNTSFTGGYSLSSSPSGTGTTANGDITYTTDIADNSGIALFKTANPANFTLANRLDAVGFNGPSGAIPDLYREGAGLAQIGTSNGQFTFVRNIITGSGGIPSDTNENSSDFLFLSTNAGVFAGVPSRLGAPGPENLSSPLLRNTTIQMVLLDTTVAASVPPNRVRDLTADPNNNSTFGTMSIRRRAVNNTGAPITRFRVRITQVTTFPTTPGIADLRALTSASFTVTVNDAGTCAALGTPNTPPCLVTVKETLLEQPPNQAAGGGYNSTLSATLPQPLAPGASLNVQFLLGVQQTGNFHFFINIEALP